MTLGQPVPEEVKQQVFAAYGLAPDEHVKQAIRLIPAALGGTNGPKNVFPVTPWFAGLKARLDALEGKLAPGGATPSPGSAPIM